MIRGVQQLRDAQDVQRNDADDICEVRTPVVPLETSPEAVTLGEFTEFFVRKPLALPRFPGPIST